MRIIYLHQYFTTPEMSGGTRSYEFARRLVSAGHDVHMITSDRTGTGKPYETVEAGIRVTWIPVPYSNAMGVADRIRAFVAFAIKSALLAANSNADVIFATSTPLTIAIPAIYAKWRQRIPMVFEVRDLWPETPIALGVLSQPMLQSAARQLERIAYRASSRIVALSPGMKAGVVKSGFPDHRITVIPNASDIEAFAVDPVLGDEYRARHTWLGSRPLVLYAGTLGYANDVRYMVRLAAATWPLNPEIRFLIIGQGREETQIRDLAMHMNVYEKNFFMMPSVSKHDIPQLFSAATITSSWVRNVEAMWANSANKFFDSLAAGRPIAINHEGWQADLLKEHNAGIVLSPTDIDDAARTLVHHITDGVWLRNARAQALTLAKTFFDRDQLASQLADVLESANTNAH